MIYVRIFYAFRMLDDMILEVYQILEKNIKRNARRMCILQKFPFNLVSLYAFL